MKKGCFITTIVIFTIMVGAALYIFQNHFDSLVSNPSKKWLTGIVKNELEKNFLVVADSPEKIELKKLIEDFSNNADALNEIKEKDLDRLLETIESAMEDSIIQKSELEEISLIINSK